APRHFPGPVGGLQVCAFGTAVRQDLPVGRGAISMSAAGVYGHDNGSRAKLRRCLVDEIRLLDGCTADGYPGGAGVQQTLDIGRAADAAADNQRQAGLPCNVLDQFGSVSTPLRGGADVKKNEFVGTLLGVAQGNFNGI